MNFKELFSEKRACFNLKGETKEEIIGELSDILYCDGVITDKESFQKAVFKREKLCSTAIGKGIAVPHGICEAVLKPAIVFGKKESGVYIDSMDGKKTEIFFLIAIPENDKDMHLPIISEISRKLVEKEFINKLKETTDYLSFISLI